MIIAVITACWKRPEILRSFLRNMGALTPAPTVIIMGSPGDDCAGAIVEDRLHLDLRYGQAPNEMGTKWNAAVAMAKLTDATHFLFMGSDDLMDQACWNYYQAYALGNGAHLALRDYYFYSAKERALAYWPGYQGERHGEPIGAAKLVRRDVLDALNWAPFKAGRPNALDHDMHTAVLAKGFTVDVVPLAETEGMSMDVKGAGSLTSWGRILQQPGVMKVPQRHLLVLSPQLWEFTSNLRK